MSLPRVDLYVAALLAAPAVALVFPARGLAYTCFGHATTIAIGLLFFLYGSYLSTKEALDGLRYWRLHVVVLAFTFVVFPVLGLASSFLVPGVLTPSLYTGTMFLCCLPSTVQSSIAFTSIARGNVAAAICSASFSNLVGTLLTPLLVAWLVGTGNGRGVNADSMLDIVVQLLLPFLAGQLLRRWIGGFVARHRKVLGYLDRASIVLVVYTAFNQGVVTGIWNSVAILSLLPVLLVDSAILTVAVVATTAAARRLGFDKRDEITIVLCGSKKSLASGVAMATILFPAATVGLVLVPLMVFHEVQMLACAWLARRYGSRPEPSQPQESTPRESR